METLHVEIAHAESFDQHQLAYDNFLRKISATAKNPAVLDNMGKIPPSGLLYLIDPARGNYQRWSKGQGEIALLYETVSGTLVGISAVEHSPLSDNISSGGNRCWVLADYRTNHAITRYLLDSNFKWTKQQNKIGMMLTFNDYNKVIYDAVVLRSKGKTATLQKFWSDWWNDCLPLPEPIMLHNTPQWAIIKPNSSHNIVKEEIKELVEIYKVQN